MEITTTGVGERVARLRKLLGLTQFRLAALAHVSVSLLKKVESGHAPASPAFTIACARALAVDTSVLTGQPYEDLFTEPGTDRAAIPELRQALDAYDDPQVDGPAWDAATLRLELNKGELLRQKSKYSDLAQRLPLLLHHLYAHEAAAGTGEVENAHALLDDAYGLAWAVAYRFGYVDLSTLAIDRLVGAAARSGDPLRVAVAAFRRSHVQLHRGDYEVGVRSVNRALVLANDQSTPEGDAVAAQLHLRQAIFAARAGKADTADSHVAEARTLVERGVPESPYFDVRANLTNVEFHSVSVPIEMSDGTTAVTRAEGVRLDDVAETSRIGHFHIDVARAWTLHGDRDRALQSLLAARQVSPLQTRYHPSVHETLSALAAADRRATDSLSGFARWAGVTL